MSGSADFSVDRDALIALQIELQLLLGALDEFDRVAVHADPTSMGGDDVADAVERFVGRWRRGRLDVIEHLSACKEVVELAISGYGETDDGLRCSIEATGEPAKGGSRA